MHVLRHSSVPLRLKTLAAALSAVTLFACSGDSKTNPDAAMAPPDGAVAPTPDATPTPDAAPPAPDAAPVVCSNLTFTAAPALSANGSDNLFGAGPGAWAANGAEGTPPGDMLYVEAYRDLITGDTVTQTSFQNWVAQCTACVFIARQCTTYTVESDKDGDPVHPACQKLFMLDKGVVTLTTFDTSPAAAGRLAGTVTPLSGESTVRLVEVNATGQPMPTSGFGSQVQGGECLEVPSLAFDGSWTAPPPPPDAGVPDANPPATDAAP